MYYHSKMTKLAAGILAAALMVGMALCCNAASASDVSETQATETSEAVETVQAEYAELPETYFITYQVTDDDGVITELSKAVDGAGNVYYKTAEEEALYCLESGNYTLYLKSGDTFTVQEGVQYTKNAVEDATADFDEYVTKANYKEELMNAEEAGETVIAGRNCTLYTASFGKLLYNVTYEYAVDQETGVCLSWDSENELFSYKLNSQAGFVCTRFDTEVADLALEMLGGD